MKKTIVIPNKYEDINTLVENTDVIAVGIKDLAVNFMEVELAKLDELATLIHSKGKKLFIALNKNMHNSNLVDAEKVLKKCDDLNINGVFYYDVAILSLAQKHNIKTKLIWSAEHLATNYNTINYWAKNGVDMTFLSNEITMNEVKEIVNNTNTSLIAQAFGYVPMYVSKRHAIDNYLKHFKLKTSSRDFYIFKEEKKYPILERKDNTEIYSYFILNGIAEYVDINIDYLLINGFKIELDKLLEVISLFKTVTSDNKDKYKERIDSMFDNTDLGFLYKEAIYQVKRNDK